MKILLLGVLLVFSSTLLFSQGLEDIIVEKVPVTAAALANDPNLPANAIAYRIFVDMAAEYEMQAVFSLDAHEMILQTTTSFYNNADFGGTSGKEIPNSLLTGNPALAFDSYITIDAATNSRVGILRSEDTGDGTVDGLTTGTALALQTVGEDFSVPFGTESFSGKFSTTSGIYNVNGGEQGTTVTNRVLIGQFTTDGVFSFELNVQIRLKGTTTLERYVASNPSGNEILFTKLNYTSTGSEVVPPSITITSPADGSSFTAGQSVSITANATDADGTVSLVEFYVDGLKTGEDASAPYQYNWTSVAGAGQITARATDNQGNQTTSSPVTISVSGSNVPPVVSITSPVNGASIVAGTLVNITANASDADGSVTKIEFFINGTKIGEDASSPYQIEWTSVSGNASLTARATDNQGNQTTSSAITVTISGQTGNSPVVSITSPSNGTVYKTGTVVNIEVSATDNGGSIVSVDFYINDQKVGSDASAPFQYSWTSTEGIMTLAAHATDNEGNQSVSEIIMITVANNLPPSVSLLSPANNSSFSPGSVITLSAQASDPDGTIALVEFFRNGTKIGEDLTAPFQMEWTSVSGVSYLSARATDNLGSKANSTNVKITVVNGVPPVVSITAPENGSSYPEGSVINITANASDNDGSVTLVEFFNNGVKLGQDDTAPYTYAWASISGSASLTAKATDNAGNQTTSSAISISLNGATTNHDTIVFDFSKAIITGNNYQLPVSIISSNEVTSFGFSVIINTSRITFDKVVNHTTYMVNSPVFEQTTKKLTISSTSQQAIEKNKKLISISYNLVTGAITPTDLTNFEAYINGVKCKVKLILTGTTPIPPTVSITSPAGGTAFGNGATVPITAVAADADGSVSMVEFFINGNKIGEDATTPYQINWTALAGTANLTAKATDNQGNQTISAIVSLNIADAGNQLPLVTISAPANGAEFSVGSGVSIIADASDADGSIARVEFYINDTKVDTDATAPYQFNWTPVAGNVVIKAIAFDNKGAKSLPATITITINAQPSVSITSPAEGAEFTAGQTVTIIANAQGGSGSITLVEFFINGFKVGQDETAPFQYNWMCVPGQAKLSALITDSKGAKTTSAIVTISVNAPPVIDIIAPADESRYPAGQIINIEATASDPDGSVAKVEFYVNGNKIGEDVTAPYQFNWTGTDGTCTITAIVTDNKGAKETSVPVTIVVFHPYEMETVEQGCNLDNICMPLQVTDPISDVIGFDIVMKYDATKVTPTGTITLYNDLINREYADYGVNINQTGGTMMISVFLKSSAPENTNFHGTGKLLCAEFSKTSAFKPVDTVAFSVNSITESYYTGILAKTAKPGKAITYKDFYFNGVLKYWSNNSPIAYDINNPGQFLISDISGTDAANCDPLSGTMVHPDLSGNFRFDVRNGRAIQIERDILPATQVQSVVNGMDAQLTMKVLLGDNSFIPSAYQMIAMDVNMDGVISSGDISQINQRAIMMIKEFKQAWNYNKQGVKVVDKPSKDWLFVNQTQVTSNTEFKISTNYPEADGTGFTRLFVPKTESCYPISVSDLENCPYIEPETYLGILLGDVNGNYGDIPTDGKLKSAKSDNAVIVFDLSHARLIGNKMEFPVYYSADYAVTSLDFEMHFNLEKLVFDTIFNKVANINADFFYNEEDSALRLTSYSLSNYQANNNLVYVRFDVTESNIQQSDFVVPLSLLNGESVTASVTEYTPVTGLINYPLKPDITVYPNPAKNLIYVEISDEATLEILDMNGRILLNKVALVAGEKQDINVEQLTTGMYMLKFQTDSYSVIKKLLINK
jgi:hypothetical protein